MCPCREAALLERRKEDTAGGAGQLPLLAAGLGRVSRARGSYLPTAQDDQSYRRPSPSGGPLPQRNVCRLVIGVVLLARVCSSGTAPMAGAVYEGLAVLQAARSKHDLRTVQLLPLQACSPSRTASSPLDSWMARAKLCGDLISNGRYFVDTRDGHIDS